MKKYFFLASVAVVALSSCSNEEISEVSVLPGTGATPIDFTAYAAGATRYTASEAGIGNLVYNADNESGGFLLTGVYTVDNELAYIENLENAVYTADAEADVHSCSPVSGQAPMWTDAIPTNADVSFYAYYPTSAGLTVSPVTLDAEGGTLTVSNVNGETDVMAADTTVKKGAAVALEFKHLLAQVEMNVRYDEDYADLLGDVLGVTLNNLTLQAPKTSVYNFANGKATVPEAIVDGGENTSRYPFISSGISTYSEFSGFGTAMIPASNDGTTCQLSVSYTFSTLNQQSYSYDKSAEVTIKAGFKNVINITLKGDSPISITASVDAWKDAEDQNINF